MKKRGVKTGEQGAGVLVASVVTLGLGGESLGNRVASTEVRERILRAEGCRQSVCAAFTLMELMAVVAIIAIVAGLTLGTLGFVNRKGAESRARAEVATLSAAIDSYKLDFGRYPTNQASLFRELTGQGSLNKTKAFIEPTPGMTTNMTNGPFIDPWGTEYQYRIDAQATNNVGFFDLWSTAGGKTDQTQWIRN